MCLPSGNLIRRSVADQRTEVVLFLGVVHVRCAHTQRFHTASEETQAATLQRERLPQTADGRSSPWILVAQEEGASTTSTEAPT
jgi:hypothetical protein